MKSFRAVLGCLVFVLGGYFAWNSIGASLEAAGSSSGEWLSGLWSYTSSSRREIYLRFPEPVDVESGDPVFVRTAEGDVLQVGEIRAVCEDGKPVYTYSETAREVQVVLYPQAGPIGPASKVTLHNAPSNYTWVAETMITPEREAQITAEIESALEKHRDLIIDDLRPLLRKTLQEGVLMLQHDLSNSLAAREDELIALGSRYRQEILDQLVLPLVREELWPIVRDLGEPVLTDVLREVWKKVSVWRFGWRILYDASPLPRQDLLEKEWERFLNDEVIPILQDHQEEFISLIEQIVETIAHNERLRDVFQETLKRVGQDQELKQLANQIIRDTLGRRSKLREMMRQLWESDEARAALQAVSDRIEPTGRRLGEILFGTPETGITPEFARVMRNQILLKDQRWLLLEIVPEESGHASREEFWLDAQWGDDAPLPVSNRK